MAGDAAAVIFRNGGSMIGYRCRRLFVYLSLTALCFCRPVSAAQKTYTLGLLFDSNTTGGQTKVIFEKCVKLISERFDFDIKIVKIKDDADWIEQTKNMSLDFTGSHKNPDPIVAAVSRYGYKPFVSYSGYGIAVKRMCVFADRNSGYKSVGDLRDKKLLINPNKHDYYFLRSIVQEKPELFFAPLKADANFDSFFYSLSLGDTDGILNNENTYEFLKMSNPGPVKNVVNIGCSKGYPPLFITHSPKVPDEVVKAISDLFKNAEKDEAFKEFRPLMKTTKLKFYTVERNDYKNLLDLYDEAEKKGWDKDFSKWLSMQKN